MKKKENKYYVNNKTSMYKIWYLKVQTVQKKVFIAEM